MIFGIGCDLVDHQTTELLQWEKDLRLLQRIFSANEIKTFKKKSSLGFLAGRFAVKEAVLKSLGTGMVDGIHLAEIEVVAGINEQPILKLSGKVAEIAQQKGIKSWYISISHTQAYSMAQVVAEK